MASRTCNEIDILQRLAIFAQSGIWEGEHTFAVLKPEDRRGSSNNSLVRLVEGGVGMKYGIGISRKHGIVCISWYTCFDWGLC